MKKSRFTEAQMMAVMIGCCASDLRHVSVFVWPQRTTAIVGRDAHY